MKSVDVEARERDLGQRVRALRRASGLTQVEVARSANLSRGAVAALEAGNGSSLSTLIRVLDAVGEARWLDTLEAPDAVFNPLDLLPDTTRARPPRGSRP